MDISKEIPKNLFDSEKILDRINEKLDGNNKEKKWSNLGIGGMDLNEQV